MNKQNNKDTNITIYSSEPLLRHPKKLFLGMYRDLLISKELAWRLFIRNISAMYRQTFLGYIWAFLPPIVTTLVFTFLNSQKIFHVGETNIPYPAYILLGTLLWQVFVDAMNSPLRSFNQSRSMLAKANFPRESLLLAGLAEVIFNFFIRLVLLFFVIIYYDIKISMLILYAPLGIISLLCLGMVFGLLLLPVGALYRDIEKGLYIITSAWFFVTPVVYPAPTKWPASIICDFNPVTPLLDFARNAFTGIKSFETEKIILINFIMIIFLLLSWILYRIAMPHIIERMSA
ncbi:predicted O-antigen export system, permease protein [Desulfobacula toluolica Tol2]|uniref:Predicted O-antigen export system, permease protein n=1 Tax=Desulfobacula toluolica (strain DSM 7467 / Tol2) TaxID=651182 RepID=K0NK71_DESTT|nr:predicted O-antigen export system, permease protein [Desulfobacula toluolica Tol2]